MAFRCQGIAGIAKEMIVRTGFIWVIAVSFILGIFAAGDCVFAADVTVDGALRYQTIEGFGDVQVSAFLHEGRGELAIVAINPTGQGQPLNLTFSNLKVPASLTAYRTSVSENLLQAGDVTINDNKAAFRMMSQSIVTLSGNIIPIVIEICAFVISTGGPRSGLKWRDLAANGKQV